MDTEQNYKEQYTNWEALETERRTEAVTQEKITERLKQSFSSRLCEYITGMKPDDPRIIERLTMDQKIVRAKYNLPDPYLPPSEFERSLEQLAHKQRVRIKPTSECGIFFEENPFAGGRHSDDGQIAVDIDRSELEKYRRSLNKLEHELVHEEQRLHAPRMPIELMEYEAYVANSNLEFLKENPDEVNNIFFNFFVGGSVNMYYRLLSEERGEEIIPEWDNPEYFLKKDGIDPKIIMAQNQSETDSFKES